MTSASELRAPEEKKHRHWGRRVFLAGVVLLGLLYVAG
jgi:hypothetical protein